MTSSLPLPENRLPRRVFVGAVATLGVAVLSGTAIAAPAITIDRAVGVAQLGKTVHILGRGSRGWVRVGVDSAAQPTRGLGLAEINGMTATGDVLVAVGAEGTIPTVWESADGVTWRRVLRLDQLDGHLTAVGVSSGDVLATGAELTLERAPHRRIVVLRTNNRWSTVPARGLAPTDELTATAVGASGTGWVMSTVDANGSVLSRSADGRVWTVEETMTGTAVKAFDRGSWVANAMADPGGVTGPRRSAAPAGQAIGMVDGRSYWLVDGHVVTATV